MDILELFHLADQMGASDLLVSAGRPPAFRCSGRFAASDLPPVEGEAIHAFRRKHLGPDNELLYQEHGGFDSSFALEKTRFRINFFSTISGPAMAVRPIMLCSKIDFAVFHLPEILEELGGLERGLVLVTGPTGSGKTTTLAAMVDSINRRFPRHILMIEDPAEYLHENGMSVVTQREIDSSMPGAFARALRFALRENPDVIVIGEIRDAESVQVAVTAALTGHLVIATIHTADAVRTVERLIGLYPEALREQAAQDLALALEAILSQQLLPAAGGGMIPAFEIMRGTATARKKIAERDFTALEALMRGGASYGMVTFNRALLSLLEKKRITRETAEEASPNPEEFRFLLEGMESGSDFFANRRSQNGGDGEMDGEISMNLLLRAAVRNEASDLVLTAGSRPLLKWNGILRPLELAVLNSSDVDRLLFSVVTRRQRVEFEEKRELDFALSATLKRVRDDEPETVCRFRINAFYQRGTPALVARVIQNRIPTPESLKLPAILSQLMEKKQGLILVTGPTGSGKSTTLASLIEEVNNRRFCHIVTIEDPIEYIYANKQSVIEQRELHADTFSFATALRAAMREAPDIVMVGEMRDVETMAAALTAAETGHLVLATVHTNSAPQTIDRIIDSFPSGQQNQIKLQLAATLQAVVSQRLLPTRDGEHRVAAFEILVATPPVQAQIREGKTHQLTSAMETGAKDGMMTLEKSMKNLFDAGLIAEEEMKKFVREGRRFEDI